MAQIIAKKFEIFDSVIYPGGSADHLLYEFLDNAGNLIAQVNGMAYDDGTFVTHGLPGELGDQIKFLITSNRQLGSHASYVIYSSNAPDAAQIVINTLESTKEFGRYINAQHLSYAPLPDDNLFFTTFNSNSAFVGVKQALRQNITFDETALTSFENATFVPGNDEDILRGQTWTPIFAVSGIIGSHVVGTSSNDEINNTRDGDDVLVGLGGNDKFGSDPGTPFVETETLTHNLVDKPIDVEHPHSDGMNTIYGGTEANKVLFDLSDGKDTYTFKTGGVNKTVFAYADRWQVVHTTDDPSDTDKLYSIEKILAPNYQIDNKGTFQYMETFLDLHDLSETELTGLQSEDDFVTSAVRVNSGTVLGNFGSFVGTSHADSFVLREVLGREFDGHTGVDVISYEDVTDEDGVTIKLNDGTAFITGTDLVSGPSVGGPYDEIVSIENAKGSNFGDTITGTSSQNYLYGLDGKDVFKGGNGADMLYGDAGDDTADYKTLGAFLKVLSVPNIAGRYSVDKYYGQTSATGSYERDELFSIEDIMGNTANGISIDDAGGKLVQGQGIDPVYGNVLPVTYASGNQSLKHTLRGTEHGETLTGGTAADVLDGRDGADTSKGGRGNDLYLYCFSADNDIIDDGGYATDLDTLWLNCNLSFSNLVFERFNASDIKITFAAGSGSVLLKNTMSIPIDYIKMRDGTVIDMETVAVTVKGTSGNDYVYGTQDNGAYREGSLVHDVMYGDAGNDNMYGYSGTDQIYGGADTDTLIGGDGGDHLYGEDGNDTLYGDAGDDFLYSGTDISTNTNFLYGGTGHDTYEGGSGTDTMTDASNSGNEIYKYSGGTDTIYDWGGSDTLRMNGSATIENTTITVSGYDIIVGGNLTITYFNYSNAYKIETIEFSDGSKANLTTHASWTKGTASNDTLNGTTSANTLVGYDGDDTVNALAGADQVFGGAGTDTLYGGSGADTIYGGDGNDIIEGGDDGDVIYGGAGSDNIKGNAGVDTFIWRSMGDTGDTIQDFNAGVGEKLDISDLLTGYDPLSSFITDFVQITDNGTNSFLAIDSDGGANNFVSLATIYGTGLTDEAALLTSGNLIAV